MSAWRHVYNIDMRKHVSAIRTTTREGNNELPVRKKARDLRVVTDDTRVLMRQTTRLGASLLLLRLLSHLSVYARARAQLLVLTLNLIPFLVGHDFCLRSRSRSSSSFCLSMRPYVLALRKNEFSDKHVKNDKLP